jgi:hypothetical protein
VWGSGHLICIGQLSVWQSRRRRYSAPAVGERHLPREHLVWWVAGCIVYQVDFL